LDGFLKGLNTGTADGENNAKPELQPVDIIPKLKSSDVYASHKMAEKRMETIHEIQSPPTKKRKLDEIASPNESSAAELDMTRQASRSRCTAAIEKIATEVSASNAMQEKFFQEQSERHASNSAEMRALVPSTSRRTYDVRSWQSKQTSIYLCSRRSMALINEEDFRAQASRLLAKMK
jgi:hypothetical protein